MMTVLNYSQKQNTQKPTNQTTTTIMKIISASISTLLACSFLSSTKANLRGSSSVRRLSNITAARTLESAAGPVPVTTVAGPIPVTPNDPSTCGVTVPYECDASGWVYCINSVCEDETTTDPLLYGGKPFNKCHCWQPTNTNSSILPHGNDGGANCVLDNGPGGEEMCEAMKNGALISTYGPKGTMRDPDTDLFELEAAICEPHTPWAWCWGAPCVEDPDSPTGITCHCPLMTSTNDDEQILYLAGESQCSGAHGSPCDSVHNSEPAGMVTGAMLKDITPCYTEE